MVLKLAPVDRRGGEDDAEDRPRARRPQQAGRDAEHGRRPDALAAAGAGAPTTANRARPAAASAARTASGRPAPCRTARAAPAPPSGRSHWPEPPSRRRPRPASRPARRSRHADQHRQRAAHEAAAGAGEDERQNRQDARADDGQHAAEISEQDDQHMVSGLSLDTSVDTGAYARFGRHSSTRPSTLLHPCVLPARNK